MKKNLLWIILILIIVVAAYYLISDIFNSQSNNQNVSTAQPSTSSLSATQEAQLSAEATSNPDSIVNNLLNESQVSSTPVESDPSLISSSSSDVLNSFNQAVDTNNL